MRKTDLYTKIVLTVIAVTLIGLLFKDVNFVGKATANELDLSELKIEAVDGDEATFFIYENSKLITPYSGYSGGIGLRDVPVYVITSKKKN